MYIISHVNPVGRREYTASNDVKDVHDILIGITGDEEYARCASADAAGLKFDQVLIAPYDFAEILAKVLLYGNEREAELDLEKRMILIWCISEDKYKYFMEGRH